MRVMLDTNILISIIIFNSARLKKLLVKICQEHTLVLGSYIINELEDVIDRKFPGKQRHLQDFLVNLPYELEYTPDIILEETAIKMRDIKDIPVLYSAILADVDILITGDKDFEDVDIERPEIMTATEFLEMYEG